LKTNSTGASIQPIAPVRTLGRWYKYKALVWKL